MMHALIKKLLALIFVIATLAGIYWVVFLSSATANKDPIIKIRIKEKQIVEDVIESLDKPTTAWYPGQLEVQTKYDDGSFVYFVAGKVTNLNIEGDTVVFKSTSGQRFIFPLPPYEYKDGVKMLTINVLNSTLNKWESKEYPLDSRDLKIIMQSRYTVINWQDTRVKTDLESFIKENDGDLTTGNSSVIRIGLNVYN